MLAESDNSDLGIYGDVDAERRSTADDGIELHRTHVVFDDFVTDRKPEPGALADFLRGKERLENSCSIGLADAEPRVMNLDANTVGFIFVECPDRKITAIRHAVDRVVGEVQDDLRDLVFIDPDRREIAV